MPALDRIFMGSKITGSASAQALRKPMRAAWRCTPHFVAGPSCDTLSVSIGVPYSNHVN